MMGINSFDYPKRIYFYADFLSIPFFDFVYIDLTFPVISKRMFNTLMFAREVDCGTIPVTMIDDNFLGDPFERDGMLKPKIKINNDYVALQIKKFSDVFDYKNSIYEPDLMFPEEVGIVAKLVLKEKRLGFPTVFKIKEAPEHLFVNADTKRELERNEIQGCVFEHVVSL